MDFSHPEISQGELELFLQRLGDGAPNQDPLDVALFKHLKIASISKENVERAARTRHGYSSVPVEFRSE